MFVVVRGFVVYEGRERDFEKVFGKEGIWPELLQHSPGARGSALRMELRGVRRRYKVCDYWRSHEDFESFREEHHQEVERFSHWLATERLVEREIFLGSFYQGVPEFDEGTGWVPM